MITVDGVDYLTYEEAIKTPGFYSSYQLYEYSGEKLVAGQHPHPEDNHSYLVVTPTTYGDAPDGRNGTVWWQVVKPTEPNHVQACMGVKSSQYVWKRVEHLELRLVVKTNINTEE